MAGGPAVRDQSRRQPDLHADSVRDEEPKEVAVEKLLMELRSGDTT